ncbi:MAG: tetratricopeptide repeat protein [Verrucomicrobiae bacterium]|nr:tetratricopeptide repeat protein [Verrucomicrobiae bacterium]
MDALNYPDRHQALAAEGWFELGRPDEAMEALRQLSPEAAQHPEVLELHWRVLAQQRNWAEALEVARRMTEAAPDRAESWIHRSFTLHELQRTFEAWTVLLPVAPRFPQESIIPYNLACYACQLGDLKVARDWLDRAARMRPKDEIKAMALKDPDLAPLRPYVEQL